MNWIRNWHARHIAVALIMGLFIIGSVPSESMAYMIGADEVAAPSTRAADLDMIQRVLESKLVARKLNQAGLSAPEVKSRLEKLNDQELHSFAKQVDTLYPGGDGLGVIIAILIIAVLVLIILKLQNKKIIIQ